MKYAFVEDFANNRGYEAAKNIRTPTLVVHGDADTQVTIEQSKKLVDIIPHSRLEVIDGADHNYTNPEHFERVVDFIFDFVYKLR